MPLERGRAKWSSLSHPHHPPPPPTSLPFEGWLQLSWPSSFLPPIRLASPNSRFSFDECASRQAVQTVDVPVLRRRGRTNKPRSWFAVDPDIPVATEGDAMGPWKMPAEVLFNWPGWPRPPKTARRLADAPIQERPPFPAPEADLGGVAPGWHYQNLFGNPRRHTPSFLDSASLVVSCSPTRSRAQMVLHVAEYRKVVVRDGEVFICFCYRESWVGNDRTERCAGLGDPVRLYFFSCHARHHLSLPVMSPQAIYTTE